MFKDGHWKIADFGLTSEATSNRLVTSRSARGKPSYRAPELLRETKAGYNNKADIWSLGCIGFELLLAGRHSLMISRYFSMQSRERLREALLQA